jgi:hypothetical protein
VQPEIGLQSSRNEPVAMNCCSWKKAERVCFCVSPTAAPPPRLTHCVHTPIESLKGFIRSVVPVECGNRKSSPPSGHSNRGCSSRCPGGVVSRPRSFRALAEVHRHSPPPGFWRLLAGSRPSRIDASSAARKSDRETCDCFLAISTPDYTLMASSGLSVAN